MRERQERAKEAVREQEKAEREQEKTVRKHRKEYIQKVCFSFRL